jgi:hypothetical protein
MVPLSSMRRFQGLRAVAAYVTGGLLVGVLGASALAACALPPTGLQKAQQTAQDFNQDSRFGRSDLALSRVDSAVRDQYADHHKAWGTSVRVADIEMAGMKPHGDGDVDVFVHVAWYRMSEQDLKQTTLKQHWHSKTDAWLLTAEERLEGDPGLLGEPIVTQAPDAPRTPAQFPTIRIGGGDDRGASTSE